MSLFASPQIQLSLHTPGGISTQNGSVSNPFQLTFLIYLIIIIIIIIIIMIIIIIYFFFSSSCRAKRREYN